MDYYRPLDSWWDLLAAFVVAPLGLAAIIWWIGPVEFTTIVVEVLAFVAVVGIPLQFVLRAATRGR